MNGKKEVYVPKKRRPILLRSCSIFFCAGTVLMWVFREKYGIETGDLLIMSGIAVLLMTCLMQGKRAEKKLEKSDEELRKIREQCCRDEYFW